MKIMSPSLTRGRHSSDISRRFRRRRGSRDWCKIISADATESEASEKQIVFLESRTSEAARLVLDDKYDNLLIPKAFGDIGIEFFYLPDILRDFDCHLDEKDKFGLLKRSMEYLVPAGSHLYCRGLLSLLNKRLDSC